MIGGKKNEKSFTATEVGTLAESLQSNISAIAERLVVVSEDITCLKTGLHERKTDMKIVRDVIRVAMPSLNVRVSTLEAKAGL